MTDERVYFFNRDNLDDIIKEHPKYTKVYFRMKNENGKAHLSLSRDSGDQIYLVSNCDHQDLNLYLKKATEVAIVQKKNINPEEANKENPSKKAKQQSLFGFINKI
ncbi:hypothetical protein GINT2_000406 [Glugoides intestinalis]